MIRKIYSKKDVDNLIKQNGFRNAIKQIYLQIQKNQNKISSSDVASIYDSNYLNCIDNNLIIKKINGYKLSYFNLFAYDLIKNNKSKILDVGCGTGNLCLALASQGHNVYGIDYNKDAINLAKKKVGKMKNVHFSTKNLFSLNDNFSYILFMDVVEHLSQQELIKFFNKAYSLLNKNGRIIIHTPNGLNSVDIRRGITLLQWPLRIYMFFKKIINPYNYQDVLNAYYQQVHINIMTPNELKKLLEKAGFKDIKFIFRGNMEGLIANLREYFKMSPDIGVIAKK